MPASAPTQVNTTPLNTMQVNTGARRVAAVCAAATALAIGAAVAMPSSWALAAVVAGVVVTIVDGARITEIYAIVDRMIHHHTWIRSVAIDASRIVAVEHPDAESSVRELLMIDDEGRSISVPLSRLHDRDEFATALEALLESTPLRAFDSAEGRTAPTSERTPVAA
jgi:hypothetical protein